MDHPMIIAAARLAVGLAGLWMCGLGILMLTMPRLALAPLARMGSTRSIHVGELVIRIVVGVAFILSASATSVQQAFVAFGSFLIISALVLLALPRRWHAAYSVWWSRRISEPAVRLIGLPSVAAGIALTWLVA